MKKPSLLIDLSKSRNPWNGLGQFCLLLGEELTKIQIHEIEVTFLIDKKDRAKFPLQQKFHWLSEWNRCTTPAIIRLILQFFSPSYDLWHVTAQDSDFWPLTRKTPTILTIHDLNFLVESKTALRKKRRLKKLQKRVDRAKYITTISEFSKQQIEQNLELGETPVSVIYNGGIKDDLEYFSAQERPLFLPDDNFLFTIGTVKEKKNFHVLLPLIQSLEKTRLVISGNSKSAYADLIRQQIKSNGLEDRVFLTGEISNKQRDWFYRHCKAFMFPSLAEGFGIPVIEAMKYGKPVFVSDQGSLPEIAADAGFFFKSFDIEAMLTVYNDGMQRYRNDDKLKQFIVERANNFSWKRSARQYLELYKKILNNSQTD